MRASAGTGARRAAATVRRVLGSALCVLLALPALGTGEHARAQEAEDGAGTDGQRITFREGTNMAAALSPDGRTLAIDVQGQIWTMPADGGAATALTDALGDARQPTWSPDGSRIAFQAYWDGNYHIWSVAADGTDLRQHTWGPYDDREPHWSPDGSRIAFASDREGSYDVWVLEVESGELERRSDHAGHEYQPAWSPSGDRIAFASDRDEDPGIYVLDGASARRVVAAEGEPFGPAWSPGGDRISFTDLHDRRSSLRVAPLPGGGSSTISARLEDVFPFRAAWRSSDELLYTGDGEIRVRPADGGPARDVAFTATVTVHRPDYERRARDFDDTSSRPVEGIGSPVLSPDGTRYAFTALGDLWVADTEYGRAERITNDVFHEMHPAWSRDGSRLLFSSDREGSMDLWVRDVRSGEEHRVTDAPGAEVQGAFSPSGEEISFVGDEGMIRVVETGSGEVRDLVDEELNSPGRPSWSPDGEHLALSVLDPYSSRYREGVNRILILDADGGEARVLEEWVPHRSIGSRGRDGPLWSPDGSMFAFVLDGLLWVADIDDGGHPLGSPRRLTNGLADYPSWSGDSGSLLYISQDRLKRVHLADGSVEEVPLDLAWRPSNPMGRTVVHAGRLFDGTADRIRRNVDVVVEGHRITAVEPHDASLHRGEVIDASDETVMPGLIEMHTHQGASAGESLGRTWLAFGVTSVREPSTDPYQSLARGEIARSGKRPVPRVFRTGRTFDGSRIYYAGGLGMEGGAQVALELDRMRATGYELVKTYVRLPDVIQKRVVERAHAYGVPVTSHEIYPAVSYGADGVEHLRGTSRRGYSPKVSELGRTYQDIIALLTETDMTITPTMRLYGGMSLTLARDPSLLDDERVRALYPDALQEELRERAEGAREGNREGLERYVRDRHDAIRRVVEGGGTIVAGTDSPIYPSGLALMTEVEDYVKVADLTPFQALQAATVNAAEALGVGEELGRVAPGALADLLIVDGNPLQDIEALRTVRSVMVNGRHHPVEELLERPAASR